MFKMWNDRCLRAPPLATEKYDVSEINKDKLREARSKVFELLAICQKDDSLRTETTTLARLYYKFRNQWRREKCLGDIKQIEKCLKRFQEMQIQKALNEIFESIPGKLSKNDPSIYLPTKQFTEFVLVQLLGAGALMKRTVELCICAYNNLSQQMSAGLFVTSMMVITASVSRIWVLCRSLTLELSQCYQALLIWTKTLRCSTSPSHMENESFPEDISVWLAETFHSKFPVVDNDISLSDTLLNLNAEETNQEMNLSTSILPVQAEMDQDTSNYEFSCEDVGQVIARADQVSSSNGQLIAAHKLQSNKKCLDSIALNNGLSERKKGKKSANIMKRVSKLLGYDNEMDAPSANKQYKTLDKSEHCQWKNQVKAADSVGQLHLILANFNKSFPDENFRGLLKCRKELKQLKKTSHNLKKEKAERRKKNNSILKDGQKILRCFFKKNSVAKKLK